ncbi:MAG: hypothetical protein QXY74_05750 [Candidatus Bathyarchaeia archaeon]
MFIRDVKFLMALILSLAVISIPVLGGDAYICYGVDVNQESLEKSFAIRFLKEIACIDLDVYNVSLHWETIPSFITDYLHPGHIQTCVEVYLTNNQSELKADIEFIDGEFYSYSLICIKNGELAIKGCNHTSIIQLARSTLEHYSLSFNATYCNQLADLLNKITRLDSKQEIETENAVLSFFPSEGGGATFRWCFKLNNVSTLKKSFAMEIDGLVLTWLIDTWRHYKIGNVEVNISKERAINIALGVVQTVPNKTSESEDATVKIIQKQINEEGAKIVSCKADLFFLESRDDCFTLDLVWFIEFNYDKICSYHMDGFAVYIGANDGQIYEVIPLGYYGSENKTETINPSLNLIVALILATPIVPIALILYRKYRHPRNIDGIKHP